MKWNESNPNRRYTPKTGRKMGLHFTTASYGTAIRRACKAAGVPEWGPNRLRHNFAQSVRDRFGLDAAQATLGHTKADTSEIYAAANRGRVAEVLGEIG